MGPEVDVYKVGGESLESFLKSPPRGRYILVHGAGKEISRIMEKRGLKPRYIGGQRCTDEKTLEVVSAVMDMTRRKIMDVFGTRAVAVRGDEFGFLAKKINKLGLVGDVYDYPDKLLLELVKKRILVISPLAKTVKGETLNINADLFAQALVSKLPVRRLVFYSDVTGVHDGNGRLIRRITGKEVRSLIAGGTINAGMIPKVLSALRARNRGARMVQIGKTVIE